MESMTNTAGHRRPGRPLKPLSEEERRVSLSLKITPETRRYLEDVARRHNVTVSRAVEIQMERARAIDSWLAAMQADSSSKIGNDHLENLLKSAGWNEAAPGVYIRPADLTVGSPDIGSPALSINPEKKEEVISRGKQPRRRG
jgi:hypothetical protein